MKRSYMPLLLSFLSLFSCTNKTENESSDKSAEQISEESDPILLAGTTPIKGLIKGGDKVTYEWKADANDYFQIQAVQDGIDFKLIFTTPNDSSMTYDSPNGLIGEENIYHIAEDSGMFTLQVVPLGQFAEEGKYSIALETKRRATMNDRAWMQAYINRRKADQLRSNSETREEAVKAYEENIPQWRALEDPHQLADAKRSLGYTLRSLGENDRAVKIFRELVSEWDDLGETRHAAFSHIILAGFHKRNQAYDSAIARTAKGIKKWQEAGDLFQETRANSDIASFYLMKGEHDTAKFFYRKTIQMAKESGSKSLLGIMYRENGNAWQTLGDTTEVMRFYKLSLENYREMNHPPAIATVTTMIGDFYARKGMNAKANQHYDLALTTWQEIGYEWQYNRLKEKLGR